MLLAFLGGAFAQSDDPPAAIAPIVQLSPSYYVVELARYAVGAEASVVVSIAALVVSTIVLTAVVAAIRRRTV